MQEKVNSSSFLGRRKALVVEDNELNREMLSAILSEEYDVLEAENGEEGLKILSQDYRDLSIVLLDVVMPVCDGYEFLERRKNDAMLSTVPVIVTTGSNSDDDQIRCLQLGASDFVSKPYNPQVVMSRVRSIIRLRESVCTLSAVEYDDISGLYTMPAFYHYASEFISANPEEKINMAVLDLQEFKLVNSLYGEKKGNEVLAYIGASLMDSGYEGLMARQGDKFFVMLLQSHFPSVQDARKQLKTIIVNAPVANLKIKVGYYENIDRETPVSILCDRVVMATAGIKQDFSKTFARYDESTQRKLLQEQQMEAAFEEALSNGEFVPWFQPKVNVHTEKVAAAEALVRWIQADGKLISPGAFVPLFEKDGLVCRLDEEMFRAVCAFQKRRIDEGKKVVPISINLSRNSIYRPHTVENYVKIVEEAGIPQSLVPIELTESAALEGESVRQLAGELTKAGFSLHMDDFGAGYSSLSSLTALPFDVIKLDKSLVDRIDSAKGDTVIRHMIDIAHEMGIQVVAEGVEKRSQVVFLQNAGCDLIQGYYFSPPRDMRMFEEILDRSDDAITLNLDDEYKRIKIDSEVTFELDDRSMTVLEKVAEGMMEGFFIYRATSDETLIYANRETIRIFGCENMEEFRKVTGNSFKGIVHPDEYAQVEQSIFQQVNASTEDSDAVEYHIIKKDGTVSYVKDRGHCVHTEVYGNVFLVFIAEEK